MRRFLALALLLLFALTSCAPASKQNPSTPSAVTTPVQGAFDGEQTVSLELVAEGLTAPLALGVIGDGRFLIADQTGLIWVLDSGGTLLEEPFLDLRDRMVTLNAGYDERGFLGLALHPDFQENGRFFVYYSAPLREGAPEGWNHTSHVSEFMVSQENANRADPGSERILMQIDEPQSNHNGGQITFGPDGYLYIPLGDGGGVGDVGLGHTEGIGNGQDITNLLGSIVRIDVDSGDPYGIPPDNPFVGADDGRDEIWAYGFRNPFRISFDAGGEGKLFAGDVGQNLFEEVDIVLRGNNYGWHIREGTHCFNPEEPSQPLDQCPDTGADGESLVPPVIEYSQPHLPGGVGRSVIGGYVYRGTALPQLVGSYVFGDWTGRENEGILLVATPLASEGELWPFSELRIVTNEGEGLGARLLSFGQDADLELYVLVSENVGPSGNTGKVFKIVPSG